MIDEEPKYGECYENTDSINYTHPVYTVALETAQFLCELIREG